MSKKVRTSRNYIILVLLILSISLLVNVFTSINNQKIKYRIGKESYKNIEEIKVSNENIQAILEKSIDLRYINNMELLNLYRNYSDIASNIIELWDEYLFYEDNKYVFRFKKELDTDRNILNDVNNNIEDYLFSILNKDMEDNLVKLQLDDSILNNFNGMKELSDKINTYYTNFYDEHLSDVEDEERSKKIIKEYYWIDILEGIHAINEEYKDYDFNLN